MTDMDRDDECCPSCTALFAARDHGYRVCAGLIPAYARPEHLETPDLDALDEDAWVVLSDDLGVLQLIEIAIGRDLTGHPAWLAAWIDASDDLAVLADAVLDREVH